MDSKEIEREEMGCVYLAQDGDQWRDFVYIPVP
jgi:hypothetical protein